MTLQRNSPRQAMEKLNLHDLIQNREKMEAIFHSTEETPSISNLISSTMQGTNVADTLTSSLAETAEKKTRELAKEAKKHAPLVAYIICAGCCCSVFSVLVIAAHITAFVGLAHTQNVDLDPLCPPHYWNANMALLFMRFIVFSLTCCTVCASGAIKNMCCTAAAIVCALVTIFSFAIADTTVTAQAWSALNCSEAVRAGRDADPLLMASGSLFVMIDWMLLLCACSTACRACRVSAEVDAV